MVDRGSTVAEDLYDSTSSNGTPSPINSFAARNASASRPSYVAPPTQLTANPVRPADAASRSSASIWPRSSCDQGGPARP